jgi:hypothetical protein
MDAGIPQAEARETDKCARIGSVATFYRACTSAFAQHLANSRANRSATHAPENRVRAKACSRPLQNRIGTGPNFSFRGPRLPGMPVLLQHRTQLTRHKVQLLSGSEK